MTAGATVFVVDDNVGVRKSLRAMLESAGLAVETYAAGEEFLAVYNPKRAGCLVRRFQIAALAPSPGWPT